MVAQSSDGRLRRRRRSLGYRPCLVRMAVGARAHLGSRRRVSFWSLLRAPEALMVWVSFQHSLERLTQPVKLTEKPIAARCVFECEEE